MTSNSFLRRHAEGWTIEREGKTQFLANFSLESWLGSDAPSDVLQGTPTDSVRPTRAPIDTQEIWAAGVTYRRSQNARVEESDFSAQAYQRVYEADRPELFYKGNAKRCAAPGAALRLRADSKWCVPEPELVLVVTAQGRIVGYTAGNDLSCRDIEGENLLYLPQAKVWDRSVSLGDTIVLTQHAETLTNLEIQLEIARGEEVLFSESANTSQLNRSLEELVHYTFREQEFPEGLFLMTGTCIVPDNYTVEPGDLMTIRVGDAKVENSAKYF